MVVFVVVVCCWGCVCGFVQAQHMRFTCDSQNIYLSILCFLKLTACVGVPVYAQLGHCAHTLDLPHVVLADQRRRRQL